MKIGIYTLGCKVNQYETQAMEQELTARGHELVDFESPADAYIINTCSVTAVSDRTVPTRWSPPAAATSRRTRRRQRASASTF